MMEKNGFGPLGNNDDLSLLEKYNDAKAFLTQFSKEQPTNFAAAAAANVVGSTSSAKAAAPEASSAAKSNNSSLQQMLLENRLDQVKQEIEETGTYRQTKAELEYGTRLAWRNSGRCIMRKVSFTLELRDCRHVQTAEECFVEIVQHLQYAYNGGTIKPVITVFPPKSSSSSSSSGSGAPVRIWNSQLMGYAGYRRKEDGSIMGDPARLDITALAIKFGWKPPITKSDFDVLPLIISDEITGHDKPKIFIIPDDAIYEVPIEHPEHHSFADLNLRWYVLPAISEIGVEIGGVHYQTCPFSGWYAVTEIGRDFLDKQRYDLAKQVSIVCDIPRTTMAIWKDDVQLQVHKAILHSFAKHSISIVDHHTASQSFQEFYHSEIKSRGKCPGDWVWLVPPAGGSMTSVFHQEMTNFILKPQYRLQQPVWKEQGIEVPPPIEIDSIKSSETMRFDAHACIYGNIIVSFGSETGTSLRYASRVATALGESCCSGGPIPMDDVPSLLEFYSTLHRQQEGGGGGGVEEQNAAANSKRNLLLVVTSTFGKGCPPSGAMNFLPELSDLPEDFIRGWDYAVLALGNSAYTQSFVHFGKAVCQALDRVGCKACMNLSIADELKNQDESFSTWTKKLYGNETGVAYTGSYLTIGEKEEDASKESAAKTTLVFKGFAPITKTLDKVKAEMDKNLLKNYQKPWINHANILTRSTDLFSFQAKESEVSRLQPGDHIALFPENSPDLAESVLRHCIVKDYAKWDEYKKMLCRDVDLSRPLTSNAIRELRQTIHHPDSKRILDLIVENCFATNDPNDTNNTYPPTGMLIHQLAAGTIPLSWIQEHCPTMAPRFFSISSVSQTRKEVTITQSAFHYSYSQKAGTTSKWLRMVLQPGDKVSAIFSTTDFHLPADTHAPLMLIAAGSGIAPFRSIWTSTEATNPMHLFFGCRDEAELPFKTEIDQLKRKGELSIYEAFSRSENSQYVQDKLVKESDIVRQLLDDERLIIYICGSPEMEFAVRSVLISVLATGSGDIKGVGVVHAAKFLARMKVQGRYIAEVYGKPLSEKDSGPIGVLWDESLAKAIQISSSLEQCGAPIPRRVDDDEEKNKESSAGEKPLARKSSRSDLLSLHTSTEGWKSAASKGSLTNHTQQKKLQRFLSGPQQRPSIIERRPSKGRWRAGAVDADLASAIAAATAAVAIDAELASAIAAADAIASPNTPGDSDNAAGTRISKGDRDDEVKDGSPLL